MVKVAIPIPITMAISIPTELHLECNSCTPDEQELFTHQRLTTNNRGDRYEIVERKLPLGIVDIAMSPQGKDDYSRSTRSLLVKILATGIIIIIKKRLAMQGREREIDTLSVRRPQPHTTNL